MNVYVTEMNLIDSGGEGVGLDKTDFLIVT